MSNIPSPRRVPGVLPPAPQSESKQSPPQARSVAQVSPRVGLTIVTDDEGHLEPPTIVQDDANLPAASSEAPGAGRQPAHTPRSATAVTPRVHLRIVTDAAVLAHSMPAIASPSPPTPADGSRSMPHTILSVRYPRSRSSM